MKMSLIAKVCILVIWLGIYPPILYIFPLNKCFVPSGVWTDAETHVRRYLIDGNIFLISEGKTTFGSDKTFLGLGKRFFPWLISWLIPKILLWSYNIIIWSYNIFIFPSNICIPWNVRCKRVNYKAVHLKFKQSSSLLIHVLILFIFPNWLSLIWKHKNDPWRVSDKLDMHSHFSCAIIDPIKRLNQNGSAPAKIKKLVSNHFQWSFSFLFVYFPSAQKSR